MAEPRATYPCPKCNRTLKQSGVVTVNGFELATFQCDECLTKIDLKDGGEGLEVALTFCVDQDGRAFDPADPDAPLRF